MSLIEQLSQLTPDEYWQLYDQLSSDFLNALPQADTDQLALYANNVRTILMALFLEDSTSVAIAIDQESTQLAKKINETNTGFRKVLSQLLTSTTLPIQHPGLTSKRMRESLPLLAMLVAQKANVSVPDTRQITPIRGRNMKEKGFYQGQIYPSTIADSYE